MTQDIDQQIKQKKLDIKMFEKELEEAKLMETAIENFNEFYQFQINEQDEKMRKEIKKMAIAKQKTCSWQNKVKVLQRKKKNLKRKLDEIYDEFCATPIWKKAKH